MLTEEDVYELVMESVMNDWLPIVLKPSYTYPHYALFNFFLFIMKYYRVWIYEYVLVHTT